MKVYQGLLIWLLTLFLGVLLFPTVFLWYDKGWGHFQNPFSIDMVNMGGLVSLYAGILSIPVIIALLIFNQILKRKNTPLPRFRAWMGGMQLIGALITFALLFAFEEYLELVTVAAIVYPVLGISLWDWGLRKFYTMHDGR